MKDINVGKCHVQSHNIRAIILELDELIEGGFCLQIKLLGGRVVGDIANLRTRSGAWRLEEHNEQQSL